MFLAPFDFVIRHRAGKTNPADAPSRRPDYQSEDTLGTELLNPLQQRLTPISPEQTSPVCINYVSVAAKVDMNRTMTRSQARAAANSAQRAAGDHLVYDAQAQEFLVKLLRKAQTDDPWTQRIKSAVQEERSDILAWSISPTGLLLWNGSIHVPPEAAVRQELLRIYHEDPLAGHFGVARTLEWLRRHVY